MGKFILRSRNVFTGLEDFPRPAAIAVEDKKIRAVLPWDYHRDKDYADWSLYDYGEKMIMSSFLDAHTHLFSGAVDGSRYVCSDLGRGRSQAECVKIIKNLRMHIRIIKEFEVLDGLLQTGVTNHFRIRDFWMKLFLTDRYILPVPTATACG